MKLYKTRDLRFYLVISFSLLVLGAVAIIMNSRFLYMNMEARTPFSIAGVAIILLLWLPLLVFTLLSLKKNYPYLILTQGLQIFILLLMGGLSLLETSDNSYGVALILLGVILIQAYQQLSMLRIVLLGIYIVIVTIAGAYMDGLLFTSISSILFDLFFLTTIAMFNKENMKKASERNKILQLIINELRSELTDKEKIKSKITAIQLDVEEFSFTQAEKEILSLMCKQGLTSNKALAENLNKSDSTIKTQLHSIFEKTGIHKRSSLIAFYRE
jgi:DNA-binding NarL/FixJ family response regulator